jgi:hypothetical protein
VYPPQKFMTRRSIELPVGSRRQCRQYLSTVSQPKYRSVKLLRYLLPIYSQCTFVMKWQHCLFLCPENEKYLSDGKILTRSIMFLMELFRNDARKRFVFTEKWQFCPPISFYVNRCVSVWLAFLMLFRACILLFSPAVYLYASYKTKILFLWIILFIGHGARDRQLNEMHKKVMFNSENMDFNGVYKKKTDIEET